MRFAFAIVGAILAVAAFPSGGSGKGGVGDARAFEAFDIYFAGHRVTGLRFRGADVFGSGRDARVVANYGKCKPTPGGGCTPQIQLVNASMCRIYPDVYVYPPELHDVNGAQGGWVRKANLFDVYAGRTAISVYASSRKRARRVARQLRPLRAGQRRERLPSPNERLLRGDGRCQHGPAGPPAGPSVSRPWRYFRAGRG
jgi:hypothetical protein